MIRSKCLLLSLVVLLSSNKNSLASNCGNEEEGRQVHALCEKEKMAEEARRGQEQAATVHGVAMGICAVGCFGIATGMGSACSVGSIVASGFDIYKSIELGNSAEANIMPLMSAVESWKSLSSNTAATTTSTVGGGAGASGSASGTSGGASGGETGGGAEAGDAGSSGGDAAGQPDASTGGESAGQPEATAGDTAGDTAADTGSDTGTETQSQDDGNDGTCFKMIVEGVQMGLRLQGAETSRELANGFADEQTKFEKQGSGNFGESGDVSNPQTQGEGSGISGVDDPGTAPEAITPSCEVGDGGGVAKFIECAAALGLGDASQLLASPQMDDAFKKGAGIGIDDFLRSLPPNPTAGQIGSAANGLNEGAQAMLPLFEQTAARLAPELNGAGSAYQSASRGKNRKKSLNPADMLSDMMKKLMPGKKEKDQQKIVKELAFGENGTRGLATNKSVSLFERITYRYQTTKQRLQKLPWSSPINRGLTR